MMDVPQKPTASKVVYQNPWITIHEDTTETVSGKTGIYAYMESRDSVMVAPVNDEGMIFLVRAFRYPTKTWGWELPGGGGDNEDLIDASRRELEEETGIRVKNIEKLSETLVCNGLMTEKQTTCIAWDLSFDGQKEQSDEAFADQKFFSPAEIEDMIKKGDINDNQTITGLRFALIWVKENYG